MTEDKTLTADRQKALEALENINDSWELTLQGWHDEYNKIKSALTTPPPQPCDCDALVKALERLTNAQKDLSDHANHHDFAPDDKVAEIEEAYRVAIKALQAHRERGK